MASFLGSIFGFEFGTKIYLFWRLWQVIPDWLVLDATGCEQSELLLLCCGSTSMIPTASLWNKSLATGCSMMVYPWVDTCCLEGASRRCSGTAEVLPSVSKVAGVWRSLFWCLESVMLWRGIMGFTKFGDKRVNDLALLSGYVVGVACLHRENPCRRICMQLAPRTSWSSVLYLSFLFAMLCSSSFCCIFICTNSKQTLLMSARSSFHWGMSTFFGDTFDVLCFHMYKLQAYFENISVLRILLEKAMPWPHLRSAVFSYVQAPIKPQF